MASSAVTAATATKLLGSRLKVDAPPNSPSGRGLAVTKPVAAGTLLLRLDPLISVLDEPFLDKACSTCFTISKSVDESVGKDLRKCTGCGLLSYCSKICQEKDWKTHHSRECQYLQLKQGTPSTLFRGVMRLVSLYAGDKEDLLFAEDVANLISHIDQIEKSRRWPVVEQLSRGIATITTATTGGKTLSSEGIRGIQQLICKFLINSITLVSATFDQLGMTFDPTIALLNHSCNPNAAIVFDGNITSVRSIRDIKEGEQVTISYVDNTYKRATRRSHLRDQYFFECRCEGCEPSDNKFTGRDSFICEKSSCRALIPEHTIKSRIVCPTCRTTQSISINTLKTLETKAMAVLEETPTSSQSASKYTNDVLLPSLASLTSCSSWPPIRQPAPALRRLVYQIALDSRNFEAAYHHSLALSSPPLSEVHPEPFHPLRTIQSFTTASLLVLLAANDNNVDRLKRAWEVLKVTWELCKGSHGEKSQFAERVASRRADVEVDISMGGEEMRQWIRTNS